MDKEVDELDESDSGVSVRVENSSRLPGIFFKDNKPLLRMPGGRIKAKLPGYLQNLKVQPNRTSGLSFEETPEGVKFIRYHGKLFVLWDWYVVC